MATGKFKAKKAFTLRKMRKVNEGDFHVAAKAALKRCQKEAASKKIIF